MAARESAIVRSILRELRSRGVWAEKTHGGPSQARGMPDIIACVGGRFAALEAKRPGESPTRLQAHTLHEIRTAGGIAVVVHSVEEALLALGLA